MLKGVNILEKDFSNLAVYKLHMKKFALLFLLFILLIPGIKGQGKRTALLLIDIQDFYFPGGKSELIGPDKAAANAALLLEKFRKKALLVIHVRHNSEPGGAINKMVTPLQGEKIISKSEVNSFKGTDLQQYLKSQSIDSLIICGMQTHMCVEAATRAASDLGYKCVLIHDACATKDLKFGEKVIKAEDVHYSTLSTLRSYCSILSTSEFLNPK